MKCLMKPVSVEQSPHDIGWGNMMSEMGRNTYGNIPTKNMSAYRPKAPRVNTCR